LLAPLTLAQRFKNKSSQTAEKTSGDTLKKELQALYEKLLVASKTRDEATLRNILTDNYSQVTPGGRVRTKTIRINETISREDEIEVLNLDSFDVYIYRASAVARCYVSNKGMFKSEAYDPKASVHRNLCQRR
jgi:hypothetical protein